MKLFKGIIHVHSNYSYDGQHSLEEIAQLGISRGYSFIGMSEHSDTLSEEKMTQYVKECQRVSTPYCLVIPGIEFTCEENLHLVGLGVHHYTGEKNPLKLIELIHEQRGIAIVAHPIRYNYQIPSNLLSIVDGIEIWNASYDGRFVPNIHSVMLVSKLRELGCPIHGFGSQDLHRISNRCKVELFVSLEKLTEEAIIRTLKEGRYKISNPYISLSPGWERRRLKLMQISIARRIYELAVKVRNKVV